MVMSGVVRCGMGLQIGSFKWYWASVGLEQGRIRMVDGGQAKVGMVDRRYCIEWCVHDTCSKL
jgi:hypothetical protein